MICSTQTEYRIFWLFTFLILFLLSNPLTSEAQDSTGNRYQNSTVFLPALGSSPETSLLFGGVGIYQFKMGDPSLSTRSSSILASGIYTLNNQSSFALQPSVILENESWILNGMFGYSYFPETFWGVGPSLNNDREMRLIYRQFFLSQSVLRQILPKMFIGPKVRWSKFYNIHFENTDGEAIEAPSYTGADDYSVAGFGFIIRWDTRDRIMVPTKNHLIEFSLMTNPSGLSTLDSYTTYTFDARKYLDLSGNGNSVLAFHLITKLNSGNPPLNDMASLGGQNILRGYYQGRLRDRHGGQLQSEFRQHVYGRFGFVVFAAAGQVWNSFDEMTFHNIHYSAGGGLRFNLNKQDPTNIRIDYGIGKNTSGLYLTIGEAF